jgi:hypothetical protein
MSEYDTQGELMERVVISFGKFNSIGFNLRYYQCLFEPAVIGYKNKQSESGLSVIYEFEKISYVEVLDGEDLIDCDWKYGFKIKLKDADHLILAAKNLNERNKWLLALCKAMESQKKSKKNVSTEQISNNKVIDQLHKENNQTEQVKIKFEEPRKNLLYPKYIETLKNGPPINPSIEKIDKIKAIVYGKINTTQKKDETINLPSKNQVDDWNYYNKQGEICDLFKVRSEMMFKPKENFTVENLFQSMNQETDELKNPTINNKLNQSLNKTKNYDKITSTATNTPHNIINNKICEKSKNDIIKVNNEIITDSEQSMTQVQENSTKKELNVKELLMKRVSPLDNYDPSKIKKMIRGKSPEDETNKSQSLKKMKPTEFLFNITEATLNSKNLTHSSIQPKLLKKNSLINFYGDQITQHQHIPSHHKNSKEVNYDEGIKKHFGKFISNYIEQGKLINSRSLNIQEEFENNPHAKSIFDIFKINPKKNEIKHTINNTKEFKFNVNASNLFTSQHNEGAEDFDTQLDKMVVSKLMEENLKNSQGYKIETKEKFINIDKAEVNEQIYDDEKNTTKDKLKEKSNLLEKMKIVSYDLLNDWEI